MAFFFSIRDLKAGRVCLDYLEPMGLRWVFSLPLQERVMRDYNMMRVGMQVTPHTHAQLTGECVGITPDTVKTHSTDHWCNCAVAAEDPQFPAVAAF